MQAGEVIGGDFEIVRPLSSGGMGSVYLVRQRSTGSERALKVMHRELVANARLRERFEQEARVSSVIESEHVVSVVAAGVDASSGMPFLVMELLRGETLAQRVDARGPLDARLGLAVFEQLFHAIAAAHRAGIVHRDLKPENIFLAHSLRAGGGVEVKVLDFGIAKLLAEANTQQTASMGTPLWMAPEQSETESRVSEATDVWALGLVVFYALTGKPYWRAAREGSSVQALLREVLLEPMPEASARAKELGLGALPAGFDAFFARATAREREARHDSARAAWGELAPVLAAAAGEVKPSEASITAVVAPVVPDLTVAGPAQARTSEAFDRTEAQHPSGSVGPNPTGSTEHDARGQTELAPRGLPPGATAHGAPLVALHGVASRPAAPTSSRAPLLVLGAVAALAAVAGVVVFSMQSGPTTEPSASSSSRATASASATVTATATASAVPPIDRNASLRNALLTIDPKQDPIRGPAGARVTMIWYSAFGCPACEDATKHVDAVMDRHPTDLRVVYRDCVLGPETRSASVAARAAFLEGGARGSEDFFAVRRYAIANPRLASINRPEGIFESALGRTAPPRGPMSLAESQVSALPACNVEGLPEVPRFFVNGALLKATPSVGSLQTAIERELQLINPKLDLGTPLETAYEEVVRANLP